MSWIIQNSSQKEDAITFEDDLFNRKKFWESLANLILNSWNESLTISIDANRGEWKTTFLKMWKNYLISERSSEEKKLNIIYFDSFKNDYIEDPFIPLFWEIINNFWLDKKTLKDKWINLIKWILPLLWKVWARWVMKWDNEQIDNDLEKLLEWDIVSQIWKTLEEYIKKDSLVKDFKLTIEKLIEEKWQIIFIIDELDRCRPDFALRLLERIKHFFDIKGLYFVLWINKKQILNYINKIYWNIESEEYLQKFIDIETNLHKNISERNSDYEKYIDYLMKKQYNDIFNPFSDRIESMIELFSFLSKHYSISFRELEKIFNYLVLTYKSLKEPNKLNSHFLIITLLFIRVKNSHIYSEIKKWNNMKYIIKEKFLFSKMEESYKEYLSNELDFIFDEEITEELAQEYEYLHRKGISSLWDIDTRRRYLNYHLDIIDSFNI